MYILSMQCMHDLYIYNYIGCSNNLNVYTAHALDTYIVYIHCISMACS